MILSVFDILFPLAISLWEIDKNIASECADVSKG